MAEPTTEQPSPKPVKDRYILGMKVRIEYPAGSVRKGEDENGQPWETKMARDYGYIDKTTGRDHENLDVILGAKPEDAERAVYVIDQVHPDTGDFDEHKVVLGAADEGEAMDDYHANYPDDWGRLGGVRAMPLGEFKKWAFGEGRRVKMAQKLKRGGLVRKMAAGGQVARDLSMANVSPISGYGSQASTGTSTGSTQPQAMPAGALTQLQSYFGDTGRNAETDMRPIEAGGGYYMPVLQGATGGIEQGTYEPERMTGWRQTQSLDPQINEANLFYDPSGKYTGMGRYSTGSSSLLNDEDFMSMAMMALPAVGGWAGLLGKAGIATGLPSWATNALVSGGISAARGGDFAKSAVGSALPGATGAALPAGVLSTAAPYLIRAAQTNRS